MADDQVQVVTDEQGVEHHFPKEATPDMISKALGLSKPQQPNLRTGAGMEAQSQQQAGQYLRQQATAPYEQQQAVLQRRKNLAAGWENNNPTPVTNATAMYAPVAAAKAIIGSKIGSKLGGAVAGPYGQLAGGLAGGVAGGVPWDRPTLGKAVIDPETLQPRAGIQLFPWMNKARATALGDVIDPNLPKMRNMLQATEESMPNRINELAAQGKQEQLLGRENAVAIKQATPKATPKIMAPNAPEAGFTGSEGRAATWEGKDLQRLAGQGNRQAITQLIRMGKELPENTRYVMGDPDMSRAVYNPREVTKFTPEGQPIRNMQNPNIPPSSKARIQLPWEQGSVAQPQLRPEVQQMAIPSGAAKVPEWQVGQRDLEITRLKGILRNPQAKDEEKAIAQSQLKNYGGTF